MGLRLEEAPAALVQGPASGVVPELKRFRLRPARFPGVGSEGPACLTFHTHDEGFTTQQNRALVGRVSEAEDGKILFRVEVRSVKVKRGRLRGTGPLRRYTA